MKIPNREKAEIAPEKLTEYLLNADHRRGGSKAQLLSEFGYHPANWHRLVYDLREFHLSAEVELVRETLYGTRYEIRAPLLTPVGRWLTLRTIWQIDEGTDTPRMITLFPD
ncbi:MAG: hypothetical protein HY318_19805 [Armatimonadetes bacterium]|nr:hypothetical protein [Armatimonadota bacterium]